MLQRITDQSSEWNCTQHDKSRGNIGHTFTWLHTDCRKKWFPFCPMSGTSFFPKGVEIDAFWQVTDLFGLFKVVWVALPVSPVAVKFWSWVPENQRDGRNVATLILVEMLFGLLVMVSTKVSSLWQTFKGNRKNYPSIINGVTESSSLPMPTVLNFLYGNVEIFIQKC